MTRSPRSGQILLPALAISFSLVLLSLTFIRWAEHQLWQMRMDMAADATALSAARSQAEMLNTIAVSNLGINFFVQKTNIPLLHDAVGLMQEGNLPNYFLWHEMLVNQVRGFSTAPAGVGEVVSRLNGAEGYAPYFPMPMNPHLSPQNIRTGIILNHLPIAGYKYLKGAYYTRDWSPGYKKAQPRHKTKWIVRRGNVQAVATARLWLDAKPSDRAHNGGFPRPQEKWLGGAFIQDWYPQFNARLIR